MNKSFFKIQNKQNLLVSCCFSPGWNKQTKKQCKTASTQTLRNTHTTDFPPAAPPSHQYIEKSAASKHSQTHLYTSAENTHGKKFTQANQKKGCIWQRTILLVFFYWKKLNSDWYLAKIYCFRACTVRNVVDFVLFYDSLNRAEKYQHKHTIHTGKNLYERLSNTRTQQQHWLTQKATRKGLNMEQKGEINQNWSTYKTRTLNTFTRWHLRHLHFKQHEYYQHTYIHTHICDIKMHTMWGRLGN